MAQCEHTADEASRQRALDRAALAVRSKRFGRAVAELSAALARWPDGAELWLLRGAAHARLGDGAAARQDSLRACALGADNALLTAAAATRLAKLGLIEEAVQQLLQTLAQRPPEARATLLEALANICLRAGRIADSVRYLAQAARLKPAHVATLSSWLRGLGDERAALEALQPAPTSAADRRCRAALLCDLGQLSEAREELSALPTISAAERLAAAQLWVRIGDFERAEQLLEVAAVAALNEAELGLLAGQLALWRGDSAVAQGYAEQLLERRAEYGAAHRLRGAALLLAGRDDEAGAALERALALAPTDAEALLWRGELARGQGDLDASLRDLDAGIRASHGYPLAGHLSRLITVVEAHQRQGALDGGTHPDAYVELLELLAPLGLPALQVAGRAHAAGLLATLYGALRRLGGNRTTRPTFIDDGVLMALDVPIHTRFAARQIQELIRLRPAEEVVAQLVALADARRGEPTIYCHIGEIYLWLGDAERADEAFRRALRDSKEVRWAYVGLCATELLRERYECALRACEEGIAAFPPPGRTLYAYRGEVYRRLGKLDQARADLLHMLELTPERISCWINLALVDQAAGDPSLLKPVYQRLGRRAPGLLDDALVELCIDRFAPLADDLLVTLFEHLLFMMRGNRSSSFVSYFTRTGELRFVP